MKICVIILTKNEEKNIVNCIKTLLWCNEILVIDDYSTDKTITLAQKMGARVFLHRLNNNFSDQRNVALQKTHADWILYIDADERVGHVLQREIQKIINTISLYNGYYIKRRDIMWGKYLQFGETANCRFLRLAKRDTGSWKGAVHEKWEVAGDIGELKNPLFHYPHQTIKEFLTEINSYTDLRVNELQKQGIKVSGISIFLYPAGKFFVNYFLKLGFLDGIQGLIITVLMSLHSFLVRSKLWLQISKK